MTKFEKILLTAVILIAGGSLFGGAVYALIAGNYLHNAGLVSCAILFVVLIAAMYYCGRTIRLIWKGVFVLFILQACDHAKSNQQVLVSNDCGMSWKEIQAGDAIPTGAGNYCHMKVVIPNFPMQGEAVFVANLKDRVKVTTNIDYDYSITNGLSFIREAKTLGKSSDTSDIDPSQFEGAENRVIDKRLRDVAKDMFLSQDIIELDQAELEDLLLAECNKRLLPLGVTLNFISITFEPDYQTKQAIDVATAMRIYESKGLVELGKEVIVARAGATEVNAEVTQTNTKEQ